MLFTDRRDAGRRLAGRLGLLRGEPVVVLGLPRGGVPVAAEVAAALGAPLDVIVVRKLGVPSRRELAMGAIGEDGVRVVNDEIVRGARVTERQLAEVEDRERVELDRRSRVFRGARPRVPLHGRTAVVVDDGLATGSTARAACEVVRAHGASRVVLAVPVAPPDWVARMGRDADELVCVATPEPFYAIGQFYDHFTQTTDDEVLACLDRAGPARDDEVLACLDRAGPARDDEVLACLDRAGAARDDEVLACLDRAGASRDDEVTVQAGPVRLGGHLTVPHGATAVVLFAHGSGSSRHSPRNHSVAEVLNASGLGTLLLDLLTVEEEGDRSVVFDVGLLATRLGDATRWLRAQPGLGHVAIGYFGASTGAGAALWAAAEPDAGVGAVVSRGGRPDLAASRLPYVTAPTLLVVGGRDDVVLGLNRRAQELLQRCESRLVVVPGATHLFEEPGTLRAAAEAARDWFVEHLCPDGRPPPTV